ncbi:MAG: NADH-quinone oxidoreductase subunit J [Ardenticatenaceae bacterium]|nr:NADH-quinone oxidoreductase subunit J [Ardenticatenaceae bacterium]
MFLNLFLLLAAVLCAFQAIRARQMLAAALWLACTSAIVAWLLYALGAQEVAVIELSVGAGLVTILFVFGITIAGEEIQEVGSLVPWAVAGGIALALIGLVAWFVLPAQEASTAVSEPSFSVMVWENRGLDMLVQIGLIFAGVLGILGILAEKETAEEQARASQKTPTSTPPLPQPQVITTDAHQDTPIKEAHA